LKNKRLKPQTRFSTHGNYVWQLFSVCQPGPSRQRPTMRMMIGGVARLASPESSPAPITGRHASPLFGVY